MVDSDGDPVVVDIGLTSAGDRRVWLEVPVGGIASFDPAMARELIARVRHAVETLDRPLLPLVSPGGNDE